MSPYRNKRLNEPTEEKKYVSRTEEPQISYVEHDSPPWSNILPKRAVCGVGSIPFQHVDRPQSVPPFARRWMSSPGDGWVRLFPVFGFSVHCAAINIHVQVFFFNLFYWRIVENVVLISATQHRGSVIPTQILLHILLHYALWQDIAYSACATQ